MATHGQKMTRQVQVVLTAYKSAAEAAQVHDHCGLCCGSRVTVSNAKNRHDNVYCYFVCSGRRSKRTDCTRRAILSVKLREVGECSYLTPIPADTVRFT